MDAKPLGGRRIRASLVSAETLAGYGNAEGLIVGVVKAAETGWNKSCTIIRIETGADESLFLLMKNNKAGFLVGRIVLIDPAASMVSWIDNLSYAFRILGPLRVPKGYRQGEERVACPECDNTVRVEKLSKHLERIHGFNIMQ